MKNNKMNINNFKNQNCYLISWVCSIFMILIFCYFGMNYMIKGTRAGFGCFSGCLAPFIDVTYLSNYPGDTLEDKSEVESGCEYHKIYTNVFDVPDGYVFLGWNTLEDGTGSEYVMDSSMCLEDDLTLYAQWAKISNVEDNENPDDDIIGENGDNDENQDKDENITEDDVENKDDSGFEELPEDTKEENGSSDSDSSDDDDENLEPDSGNGDNSSVDNSDSNNTESSSGSGTGSGTGADTDKNDGTGSSSGGNSNNKPSNNNSSNNNGSSASTEKPQTNNNTVVEKKYYQFKFIYEDNEYASSSCEVLSDGTCLMLLPGVNPNKDGYVFSGWSLNKDCPTEEIITSSMSVNSNNTYYACFIKRADNTKVNFVTVGIIVFVIWVVALTLIYVLVKWFKKKESNN